MVNKIMNQLKSSGITLPNWVPAFLGVAISIGVVFAPVFAMYTSQQVMMNRLNVLESIVESHVDLDAHSQTGRTMERLNEQISHLRSDITELRGEINRLRNIGINNSKPD